MNRNNGVEEDVILIHEVLSEHRIRIEAAPKCKEAAVLYITGKTLPAIYN